MKINPNDCKAGKSRGVLFRCNVHTDKKKAEKKNACRNWKLKKSF